MSYLDFSKEELVNLEFSLNREFLKTNIGHANMCTSLVYCNTRKYHGLLIAPQPSVDNENHVLLSSLDETIIQGTQEFNLGIHKYPVEIYYPNGHKYLRSYSNYPTPKHVYRIGGVLLSKEIVLSEKESQILVRYKVLESPSKVLMRIRPMLAFRQVHKLGKANDKANKEYAPVENGIEVNMYNGYDSLYIQSSAKNEYIHLPCWYYNVEYWQEKERGYDFLEDLYNPGYFEFTMDPEKEICFSVGLKKVSPSQIKRQFSMELAKQPSVNTMEECLETTAKSFFIKEGKRTEVVAGYPWFGRWGRDTFISLPGLTLFSGNFALCKSVIDTMASELNGPLFPNIGSGDNSAYNSVDAPLWFFWALQQYAELSGTKDKIWKEYKDKILLILEGFKMGAPYNIHLTVDGLVWAGEEGKALTWMDAVVYGKAVTGRIGMPVEINALWYNALMFSLEVAKLAKDEKFVSQWQPMADSFPTAFKNVFWEKEKGWLADYVSGDYKDFSIRPNMIFAASLPYSPLSLKIKQLIVEKVKKELVTPRGLRTLSPTHPDYKEHCKGSQEERDLAYHQGTVWPWLLGHFAEAYLKVYEKSGVAYIENLYEGFEKTLSEAGIASISEIYDGNPPHLPRGTISQAWSVAEILRIKWLIEQYKTK